MKLQKQSAAKFAKNSAASTFRHIENALTV